MCMTLAQHRLECQRRACTATAFLPVSEYFPGLPPGFLQWAHPNIPGSGPGHRQGLLHTHSHFVKRERRHREKKYRFICRLDSRRIIKPGSASDLTTNNHMVMRLTCKP
jgi:hypothetical protein